jgi:hypothetical protein
VADEIDKPQFAAAVGLMLIDAESVPSTSGKHHKPSDSGKKLLKKSGGMLGGLLKRFKS